MACKASHFLCTVWACVPRWNSGVLFNSTSRSSACGHMAKSPYKAAETELHQLPGPEWWRSMSGLKTVWRLARVKDCPCMQRRKKPASAQEPERREVPISRLRQTRDSRVHLDVVSEACCPHEAHLRIMPALRRCRDEVSSCRCHVRHHKPVSQG